MRSQIEAAGWRVVDRGTDFALSAAASPDVTVDGRLRYGSSASVPSRLTEPASGLATIVLVATDDLDGIRRIVSQQRVFPDGSSVVIVANDPSDEPTAVLDGLTMASGNGDATVPLDVVWTNERLGIGSVLNIGIRRAIAPVVIVLGSSVEAAGDFVTPLVRALDDPTVAVAGPWGMVSADLRRFDDAPPGDVDVIDGAVQAFRRDDAAARGPVDEQFGTTRHLAIWWSFVLRDGGEGGPHRRAISIGDLRVERFDQRGRAATPDQARDRDRRERRDFYRVLDRFGSRRDLLITR